MSAAAGPVFGNLAALFERKDSKPTGDCPGCGGGNFFYLVRVADGTRTVRWCSDCGTIMSNGTGTEPVSFVPRRVEDQVLRLKLKRG